MGFGNLDDPAHPGQSVIGGLNTGQMFWYNSQTGQSKIVETGIEPNPIRMRSIGTPRTGG
ncbi:hypothetical protein C1I98_38980 [Spongiactinospora gelatinilytica]|uniref:Uncharacterized protein n=1 Tax=Spongiactinospora gelatinilytica TaxID=2666298 RepID=A0A2W2F4F8_9ACTN|nr:hypothetical protein C1I98_38980 [Spongiactinospora gelatinilytica]